MKFITILIMVMTIFLTGCSNHKQELWDKYQKANEAYKLGMLSDAEGMYLEITKENPTLFEVWLKLGNIYVRTDQLEAAIRVYEKAVKINPKDVRVWNNLALTRVKQSTRILMEGRRNMRPSSNEFKMLDNALKRILKATI